MRRYALLTLLGLLFFPSNIFASEERTSGNEFYAACQDKKSLPVCVGFIAGVVDAYVWLKEDDETCIGRKLQNPDITAEQLYDVVMKHLKNNPETRDQSAVRLIIKSMSYVTGCPANY